MQSGHYVTVLFVIIIAYSVQSQNCIFYGKKCNSHANCCGGCCFDNICIDTYRSCDTHEDLCLQHHCPAGQECYLFQPNFIGSDTLAACRESEREEIISSPQAIQV